ncbi:hypothetical protein MNBD_GAMMA09-1387 [hydrothermal vent metagenome]|uniref:Lipoprotein n=1 Tax=hydrothermal vent metagenome TaxID=652676 RepID=A0A3B0Y6X9_9ZZZZ
MKLIRSFIALTAFLLISACSDDTSTASSSKAAITSSNSQDLAIAATEGAKQSINTDSASIFKTSTSSFNTEAFSKTVIDQTQQAADNGALPDYNNLCSSGTSTANTPVNNNGGTTTNTSITFTNCDLNATGVIVNGDLSVTTSYNATTFATSFSMIYNNFTVSYQGNIENINFSMECGTTTNSTTNAFEYSCTSSSSILGIDGRNYFVDNISVSGDFNSGFNVSATVTDPDHGDISIKATNVLFDCAAPYAGRPSTGSISFTDNTKSGSITFDSCSSYTVAVDGVATSYTWPVSP